MWQCNKYWSRKAAVERHIKRLSRRAKKQNTCNDEQNQIKNIKDEEEENILTATINVKTKKLQISKEKEGCLSACGSFYYKSATFSDTQLRYAVFVFRQSHFLIRLFYGTIQARVHRKFDKNGYADISNNQRILRVWFQPNNLGSAVRIEILLA